MGRKGSYKTDRKSRVYLFRVKDNAVKIGFSDEPIGRLKVLKSGNDEAELLSDFPVSNAKACEKILHKNFEYLNISHEIFEDRPEIHNIFIKIAGLKQVITPQMLAEIVKGNTMETITKDKKEFAYETVRKGMPIYQSKELFLGMMSVAWDGWAQLEKLDKVIEVEKSQTGTGTKFAHTQLKKEAVVELIKSNFLGAEISVSVLNSHLRANQKKEMVSPFAFKAAITLLTKDPNYKVIGEDGKFVVSSRLNG